jgi:hypothetical protein
MQNLSGTILERPGWITPQFGIGQVVSLSKVTMVLRITAIILTTATTARSYRIKPPQFPQRCHSQFRIWSFRYFESFAFLNLQLIKDVRIAHFT